MSKKKKRGVPVAPPKQEKKMVIDMNEVNRKMQHTVPSFRTGKHMTDKDRPRKKNWKREYEKDRESGRYNDTDPGSFQLYWEWFNSIAIYSRRTEEFDCTMLV